jgi:DNA-binding NarL/FixJ family response regulator
MSISVLLADDSPLTRKAITSLLNFDLEIHVLADAADFKQTMLLATTLRPQVIIMDVYMGRGTSVTPSEIKSALADSKVLAISFSYDDETKAIADSYGAVELLDKTKLADELIPAIRRCVNGEKTNCPAT